MIKSVRPFYLLFLLLLLLQACDTPGGASAAPALPAEEESSTPITSKGYTPQIDTLSLSEFEALFPSRGVNGHLFPDSISALDCGYIESNFPEGPDGWNPFLMDWSYKRIAVGDEYRELKAFGHPHALLRRADSSYLLGFIYHEEEVSLNLEVRAFDRYLQPIVEPEHEHENYVLAYCGGDGGFMGTRRGYLLNDSIYVYQTIECDDSGCNTSKGVIAWGHQGEIAFYPYDEDSLMQAQKVEKELPWIALAKPYFLHQKAFKTTMDGDWESSKYLHLPEGLEDSLLADFCLAYAKDIYADQPKFWEDSLFTITKEKAVKYHCPKSLMPYTYFQNDAGIYYLGFIDHWSKFPRLLMLSFSREGEFVGYVMLEQHHYRELIAYTERLAPDLLKVTRLPYRENNFKESEPKTYRMMLEGGFEVVE